jgi:hypothetical protein
MHLADYGGEMPKSSVAQVTGKEWREWVKVGARNGFPLGVWVANSRLSQGICAWLRKPDRGRGVETGRGRRVSDDRVHRTAGPKAGATQGGDGVQAPAPLPPLFRHCLPAAASVRLSWPLASYGHRGPGL